MQAPAAGRSTYAAAVPVQLRPLAPSDAAELSALLVANREFLAASDPDRSEDYYTPAGQAQSLRAVAADHAARRRAAWGIVQNGALVGKVSVFDVERGPLQAARLGYWVSRHLNGRGIATAAVGLAVGEVFDLVGLHRLEAATLTTNVGSQRVLERNGFTAIGTAPSYLLVGGRWRDHVLWQLTEQDARG